MAFLDWICSTIDYARSLANSGWEGARSTRDNSLAAKPVSFVLSRSARESLLPAAVGAYIGALGASLGNRRKPNYGVVALSSLLGGTIGFASGMAWGTRRLTGGVARGALKGIDARRDAHWLERNPIDYA
jgi:hypothetical protein